MKNSNDVSATGVQAKSECQKGLIEFKRTLELFREGVKSELQKFGMNNNQPICDSKYMSRLDKLIEGYRELNRILDELSKETADLINDLRELEAA